MAAHGKEILMSPQKKTKDLRGPQRRIARLMPFHFEGYIHVLAYRILVPIMILWGLLIIVYLLATGGGGQASGWLGTLLKVVTAVVWVLWTPQLFEVAKGLALAWSRGMVFGKLNEEFAHLYRKRYGAKTGLRVLPALFLVIWLAGFVLMIVGWQP
jgi:hypothetical protein